MKWNQDILSAVLRRALARGGDYADLFIEHSARNSITLDAGKINSINSGIVAGAGIRVITGNDFVYMFASDIDERKLFELGDEVAQAVQAGQRGTVAGMTACTGNSILPVERYPGSVPLAEKVAVVQRADSAARNYSDKIADAMVRYIDSDQQVYIATSEGRYGEDRRVRTRLMVQSIAREGDLRETGLSAPGRGMGFEFFDSISPESVAEEASRIACLLLDADYAPQGTFPVVIDNGFGGVIFHEACGHALEATSVAKNASVFSGKLGERIASEVVTAVDDGTLKNGWGSLNIDDEAHPTQRNILVEKGVLKSYMVDKLGSVRMDHPLTGSSRRESYQFAPTSRMTNTFITPGESTLEEMIGEIPEGLYCRRMGGGSVNPPTTDFNFSVMEAYLIRQGKIDRPVKGASLIGKGSEILMNIERVGKELELGTGMCGSLSGSIPANVGQPPILVSGLVIGGRS